MARTRVSVIIAIVGLAVLAACPARFAIHHAQAQQPQASPPKAKAHGHAHGDHEHAPIPAAYANAHIPTQVWTDAKMIERGKEIFIAKCALCHGEKGDAKGPGTASISCRISSA